MNKQTKIISQIENLLLELKKEVGIPNSTIPNISHRDTNNKETYSGLTKEVFNLITDGFFDKPKTLSEIQKKLKEDGVNKPTTALMAPVLLLIRKKVLARSKPEKGQYQYYKRSK